MYFIYSDLQTWHVFLRIRHLITILWRDLSLGLWLLQKIYAISQHPKLPITTGRTTLIFHVTPPPWYIRHWSHDFRGEAYSLKLPLSCHLVLNRRTTPRESRRLKRFSTFLTTKNKTFLLPITMVAPKTHFPTYPTPPTLPTTTIPSTSPHFSMNSFDYLLRCLSSRYCQTP